MVQLNSDNSSRRWLAAFLAMAAGGLFVFRGCSSVDSGGSKGPERAGLGSERIEIPKFGRPEEAKRYFDAMTDGDQRSLQLLEQALAAAKANVGVDPKYVAELEHERTLRRARLKAYQEARGTV